MISYEKLCKTVHPNQAEITVGDLREMIAKYGHDPYELISVAFLLGFQRGKRAGKEGK